MVPKQNNQMMIERVQMTTEKKPTLLTEPFFDLIDFVGLQDSSSPIVFLGYINKQLSGHLATKRFHWWRDDRKLACVAGVERGRGRGNLGARESASSRALILFPFPFERLPRRLTVN